MGQEVSMVHLYHWHLSAIVQRPECHGRASDSGSDSVTLWHATQSDYTIYTV
jgi:hypothetical protein